MNLPVAILAGGTATRLRPITESIPKALVEVAGKPFVLHQLDLLKRNGFSHIVFCVGYLGEQIISLVGDGNNLGMNINYVSDGEKLLGTGGALRKALPLLGDSFFVLYGDTYLDCNYSAIEKAFLVSGKLGLMTVFKNNNKWDRSNVIFVDGHIVRYDKHDSDPEMHYIDYGVGVFSANVFNAYPKDTVIDLAKIYQDLLARHELAGFEVEKRFYEIGTPAGLEETRMYLSSLKGVL